MTRSPTAFTHEEVEAIKEQFAIGFNQSLGRENLPMLKIDARRIGDQIAYAVRAFLVAKDTVEKEEVAVESRDFPVDWFEAFKLRWFPAWLLRRYPVRYETVVKTVVNRTIRRMCPHIHVDEQDRHIRFIVGQELPDERWGR